MLKRSALIAIALALAAPAVTAQFRVEISGVGGTQLPIAIAGFKDEDKDRKSVV